ncbi:MAG: hypothetical protein ACFHWZ_13215 [Phycisphaerales bacterium]
MSENAGAIQRRGGRQMHSAGLENATLQTGIRPALQSVPETVQALRNATLAGREACGVVLVRLVFRMV